MPTDLALFDRFPALRNSLPVVELGQFPTPVTEAGRGAARLDCASLWIKHDENCAPAYGGNKIRKLEFLLADAKDRGARSVLTFGGAGSNHALATAIHCKQIGLGCTVVLTPEPATDAVRRTLRYHLMLGTDIRYAEHYSDVRTLADAVLAEQGETCYEIPFGGSSWVGSCGFVNAGLELAEQINAGELPAPDRIYIAMGTTGSAAGLALGFALANVAAQIEAVQVTPSSMRQDLLFAQLFSEANKALNARDVHIPLLSRPFAQATLRDDQLGEGYAMPTDAGRAAAEFMTDELQIPGSLTYTAKAMAALLADAKAGQLEGQHVLFWNTYNARPYPSLPEDNRWKQLPPAMHKFFAP
jgi:D-cysteine desulfhydrase